MKSKIATIMLILALAILTVGCTTNSSEETTQDNASQETDSPLVIKASFYPLAHFAEQVAGDLGDVESLTPTGAEPHSFEPSAKAIASIYEADLFIYNGAMLDPWAEDLHHELEEEGVTVIEMSSYFALKEWAEHEEEDHDDHEDHEDEDHHEEEHEDHDDDDHHEEEHDDHEDDDHHEEEHDDHNHGEFDPHIWLDPILVEQQILIIQDILIQIDPENEDTYRDNATQATAELSQLSTDFTLQLSRCEHDTIIVAHDAFGYLANRYGFEIRAISGVSPEDEPSSKEMTELVDLALDYGISYIFFEELASPKLSETIASEIGAETLVLNPLEGLTEAQVEAGETYVTIMRQNLDNLTLALECQ